MQAPPPYTVTPAVVSSWRGTMVAVVVALGIVIALIGACLAGLGFFDTHPSDATLIAIFHTHRAEFAQLRQLFREDVGVSRIAPTFTRGSLTAERWETYRALFQAVQLESGIEDYGGKEIIAFLASSSGMATSGSSKGYVYSSVPLPAVEGDLESAPSADGERIYRHIEGPWYLFYEWS